MYLLYFLANTHGRRIEDGRSCGLGFPVWIHQFVRVVLEPDLVLKLGVVLARPILNDFKLSTMGMIHRTRWHPMWIILGCGSCMPT